SSRPIGSAAALTRLRYDDLPVGTGAGGPGEVALPLLIRAAIVIGAAVAVIGLLLLFDVLSLVREAAARGWQWFLHSGLPVAKVYGVRKVTAPLWRVVTKGLIALLGVKLYVHLMKT